MINYLAIRERIFAMLNKEQRNKDLPSDYWKVNLDTLKFYEANIALAKAVIFDKLQKADNGRSVVIEAGGGVGRICLSIQKNLPIGYLCHCGSAAKPIIFFTLSYDAF